MSHSPHPVLTGTLHQTPLAEFLVQAYDRGAEGTLLLQTEDRQKNAIWFFRGAPAKARLHDRNITLSKVVVDLGLVSEPLARSSQEQAETAQRLHGEVMIELGYIDQAGLFLALREQLVRQTLALCRLAPSTGFGFYEENFLTNWGHQGQWRVKPLRILWRALVDHLPEQRTLAWLAKIHESPLRLRVEAPVSRYDLTKKEQSIVDMIRVKPATVAGLVESGVGDAAFIGRVVCGLLLTRQLDFGFKTDPVGLHEPPETPQSLAPPETRVARRSVSVPRPSALPSEFEEVSPPSASQAKPPSSRSQGSTLPLAEGSSGRSVTAPSPQVRVTTNPEATSMPPLSADIEAFTLAIEQYEQQPPKNYYEVLGLERGADTAQVRTAFFQLARKWHPDKLPAALAEMRPTVTRAFAAMGEAHQTLMDETKRAEYDHGLQSVPDDEQQQVASILRAASAHQRAEIFFKKKAYNEALAEAKIAYDIDSTQPGYVTLFAWLHALVNPEEDHSVQIQLMSKVLESTPNHVLTLWYRGQLYKKAGQPAKAYRDFSQIVKLKPNHVDAAREVRVYKMRRQTDPKADSSSSKGTGIFGAFRKKS